MGAQKYDPIKMKVLRKLISQMILHNELEKYIRSIALLVVWKCVNGVNCVVNYGVCSYITSDHSNLKHFVIIYLL